MTKKHATAVIKVRCLPEPQLKPTREYRHKHSMPAGLFSDENQKRLKAARSSNTSGKASGKKIGADEIKKGIELREKGMTWQETGKVLEVTGGAIRVAIRRHGNE